MAKPVQSRRCPATVSGPHRPGARSPSQVAMSEPSCEREGITMSPWRRLRLVPPLVLALLVAACAQSGSSPSAAASPSGEPSLPATATPEPATAYPLTLTDDAGREVTLEAAARSASSAWRHRTPRSSAPWAPATAWSACPSTRSAIPMTWRPPLPTCRSSSASARSIVEAIVAAEPDLVLAAGNELTSTQDIDALTDLGLPVIVLYPESLDEVSADIELVGEALDAQAEAADVTCRHGRDDRRCGGCRRRRGGAAHLLRGERLRGHDLHRRRGLVPGVPDRDGRRRPDHRRCRYDRHRAGGSRHGRSGADRAGRRRVRPDHHRRDGRVARRLGRDDGRGRRAGGAAAGGHPDHAPRAADHRRPRGAGTGHPPRARSTDARRHRPGGDPPAPDRRDADQDGAGAGRWRPAPRHPAGHRRGAGQHPDRDR